MGKIKQFVSETLMDAIIIILLIFFIQNYIASLFQINGPSMCNTLNYTESEECLSGNGEYVIVKKIGVKKFLGIKFTDYKRGDIVVFKPPNGKFGEYYIKRIIGLPGETVEINDGKVKIINDDNEDGFYVNEEEYLNENNLNQTMVRGSSETIFEVPEEKYFVLGDNRKQSSDSRICFSAAGCNEDNTAFVERKLIDGIAEAVIWPPKNIRGLKDPFKESK